MNPIDLLPTKISQPLSHSLASLKRECPRATGRRRLSRPWCGRLRSRVRSWYKIRASQEKNRWKNIFKIWNKYKKEALSYKVETTKFKEVTRVTRSLYRGTNRSKVSRRKASKRGTPRKGNSSRWWWTTTVRHYSNYKIKIIITKTRNSELILSRRGGRTSRATSLKTCVNCISNNSNISKASKSQAPQNKQTPAISKLTSAGATASKMPRETKTKIQTAATVMTKVKGNN